MTDLTSVSGAEAFGLLLDDPELAGAVTDGMGRVEASLRDSVSHVDNFIAIINQPNSAILAVSSARKKVVATDEDEVEIRTRMNITCSFDHRVVDGAVGAKFINVVKSYLENPTRLLS